MAKLNLYLILLISLFTISGAAELAVGSHQRSTTRAFVESQCQGTRYPNVCVNCLSNYVNSTTQSPKQLAHIALRVSLARAQYARVYLTKVAKQLKQMKAKEYQATRDCIDQIADGAEQLTRAVKELQRFKEADENNFVWGQSNIQTWTSAALTDALTCMEGFSGFPKGGKTRAIIKAKVLSVVQVTSNALALFNRYVARHRASHATKP